jgi:hypothetical protein
MRIACSATGNSMEAGAGLILREDPRYFRVPNRPLMHRVGNVVRLTFVARSYGGIFGPAYARYMATGGNNFLSNTRRVHSEANAQHALLRTEETSPDAWGPCVRGILARCQKACFPQAQVKLFLRGSRIYGEIANR